MTGLDTLAAAAHLFGLEIGGPRWKTGLVAFLLAERFAVPPQEALERAMYGDDPEVQAASAEADRMIKQAERAALARDYQTTGDVA